MKIVIMFLKLEPKPRFAMRYEKSRIQCAERTDRLNQICTPDPSGGVLFKHHDL